MPAGRGLISRCLLSLRMQTARAFRYREPIDSRFRRQQRGGDRSAAEDEGWPRGIAETPGIGWLLLTALLAVAVTVIGSALPALRAGRTRIIDALRYE